MFIPALICGVAFTSCNADKDAPEVKTNGGLYVVGVKSAAVPTDKTDLVFTGDDIVSFDVLSGEIVFTEEKFDDIMARVSLHTELHFFIDDKPVFDPPIQINYGWRVSFDDFDLQFRTDGHKIHLTEWYMIVDSLPEVYRELKQLEMEANRQHRKKELEVFIEYLKSAGKIGQSTVLPPYLENPNELVVTDTLKIEGKFVGAFSVTSLSAPIVKGTMTLELKNGEYSILEFPHNQAEFSGNYSISENKIVFDVKVWKTDYIDENGMALAFDFDTFIVPQGEYIYLFDGNKLKFSKSEDFADYEWEFTKQ